MNQAILEARAIAKAAKILEKAFAKVSLRAGYNNEQFRNNEITVVFSLTRKQAIKKMKGSVKSPTGVFTEVDGEIIYCEILGESPTSYSLKCFFLHDIKYSFRLKTDCFTLKSKAITHFKR